MLTGILKPTSGFIGLMARFLRTSDYVKDIGVVLGKELGVVGFGTKNLHPSLKIYDVLSIST